MNLSSFNIKKYLQLFIIIVSILIKVYGKTQTDSPELLQIRRILIGPIQEWQDLKMSKHLIQNEYPNSTPFFCDGKMGPGKRSSTRPISVHELTPGDIDIIMGMGDSFTAGNGLLATNSFGIAIENRGLSWSTGGQSTWRKFITLPNILKEFNPNLYGYALKTTVSTDRASRFNVAEGGAMSRDMPYQAQVLIHRLKHDPKVNMTNDWKILTLMIGANDFCSEICYYPNPKSVVKNHERDLLKTLRILRDNIPRLFVNLVIPPNVEILRYFTNKPLRCVFAHILECSCFFSKSQQFVNFYKQIILDWIEKDYEVAYRSEFNTKDFTVSVQPLLTTINLPTFENGSIDYSYMSTDCFHLTQKLHKFTAISLWNNMLEPEGNKTKMSGINKVVKCPTEEMRFLKTRENSKIN